jgi:hypothetical protein
LGLKGTSASLFVRSDREGKTVILTASVISNFGSSQVTELVTCILTDFGSTLTVTETKNRLKHAFQAVKI